MSRFGISAEQRRASLQDLAQRPPVAFPPTGVEENFDASWDAFSHNDMGAISLHQNLEDRYDAYTEEIYNLTGKRVVSPMERLQMPPGADMRGPTVAEWQTHWETQAREFDAGVTELAREFPQLRSQVKPWDKIQADIAGEGHRLEERLGRVAAGSASGWNFAARLAGGAAASLQDPFNVASMFIGGSGSARVLTKVLVEAGINMGVEAVQQPGVQRYRAQLGLEAGLDPALQNIFYAGVGGAVFAGAGAAVGAGFRGLGKLAADVRERFQPDAMPVEVRAALQVADDIEMTRSMAPRIDQERPPTVGEANGHARNLDAAERALRGDEAAAARLAEAEQLGRAYDRTLQEGPHGNPVEILATLNPERLGAVVVERGAAIERDGRLEISGRALARIFGTRRNFGMVKFIWEHGERSGKPAARQIVRDDVMALPEVLRDFEPTAAEKRPDGTQNLRWTVERGGRSVNYGVTIPPGGRGRAVTIHIEERPGPLSQRKTGEPPSSPLPAMNRAAGYAQGQFTVSTEGPGGTPAPRNVSPAVSDIKAPADAEAQLKATEQTSPDLPAAALERAAREDPERQVIVGYAEKDGELAPVTKPLREVMEDLDEQARVAKEIRACAGGGNG